LGNDVRACDANNKSVFGRGIFVLVLGHKSFSCIVVGLSLTSAAVLDLVTLEVRLVFDHFDETHGDGGERRERREEEK